MSNLEGEKTAEGHTGYWCHNKLQKKQALSGNISERWHSTVLLWCSRNPDASQHPHQFRQRPLYISNKPI